MAPFIHVQNEDLLSEEMHIQLIILSKESCREESECSILEIKLLSWSLVSTSNRGSRHLLWDTGDRNQVFVQSTQPCLVPQVVFNPPSELLQSRGSSLIEGVWRRVCEPCYPYTPWTFWIDDIRKQGTREGYSSKRKASPSTEYTVSAVSWISPHSFISCNKGWPRTNIPPCLNLIQQNNWTLYPSQCLWCLAPCWSLQHTVHISNPLSNSWPQGLLCMSSPSNQTPLIYGEDSLGLQLRFSDLLYWCCLNAERSKNCLSKSGENPDECQPKPCSKLSNVGYEQIHSDLDVTTWNINVYWKL